MIGKTNALAGAKQKTEMVNISLVSNQTDHSDLLGTVITLSYGAYSEDIVWKGSEITRSVPAYIDYTVTFGDVTGYSTPSAVSCTAVEGNARSVTGTYQTCIVTVVVADNQTSYDDISGVTVAVTGSVSATLSSGGTVKVPWGGSITATGSEVTGYSIPSGTVSADGISKTLTLTYATEVLTLKMATDGETPTGYTLTVKSTSGTTLATQTTATGTYKIPYGTSYYVTASEVDGFTTPGNSDTYTASGSSNAARTITMTYEETKAETLTVKVSGITSGFTVYVKDSSGTTLGSQTTASKTYSIEAGTKYYVTAKNVTGYVTPANSSTYTAVAGGTRSVTMAYVAHSGTTSPTNGVYIQDTDGYYHTASEWDGTYTANGIAVITDNCRFVMALENAHSSTCQWGGYGTKVSGITTATSETSAQADYDGEAQTTVIISALDGTNDGYCDGAPAAEYCRAYTFPDGSTGYLGAAGEWQAALDNKDDIATALSTCGGTSLSYYYWTSTQYSSNYSWGMDWDGEYLSLDRKGSRNYVRAFAAI